MNNLCRDGQSTQNLSGGARNAQSSWINAAFLGGVDATTGSTYNGGLENYPRFHEDWGGTTLTYQGAFVSLGTPTHVSTASGVAPADPTRAAATSTARPPACGTSTPASTTPPTRRR
ncbi:MAG: hypothetical protein U0802_22005 [Candidatus Binatia bacterium]